MIRNYFLKLLTYDRWANRECVAAMLKAGLSDAKAIAFISHIVAAESLWLERLQGKPQSMAVWPGLTLEQCVPLIDSVADQWNEYLTRLPEEALGRECVYRNTKGELWTSRVDDIVTHVFFHSAYHRGQIARDMRAAGFQPAYTDFIHAVRGGFVK